MPTDPITTAGIIAGGINATAWIWEKIGEHATDKIFKAAADKWDETRWHKATEDYRAKIRNLYGTMQIMGMSGPISLDHIFTDAYLLDKPTAFGRFDIEALKKRSSDPNAPSYAQRLNGLRLVVENDNLFILGKPGAGKTTFLKYIALKAAEGTINKVPIFIGLKQWTDSRLPLMEFIVERFDICGFPAAKPFVEELLNSGQAIALFDGLDEVNQENGQRDRQTGAMNDFIDKYDRTQCLVTCRIAASDYSFEPFMYVEIADFTEAQIRTFVRNWFRTEEKRDKNTFAKFFAEFERGDNEGLRDMARTPLLLTLLCLAFNETLTFPQRRVEIYKEALDALLKKWDSTRRITRDEIYRKLSLGRKENLFAQVAYETFVGNQYFIPQVELEKRIVSYVKNIPPHDTNEETDGEPILKAMEAQHGIFVERAREIYSFSHLTFQEYFTARYIVDHTAQQTLKDLAAHCADSRWRETFLLATSLLPDASNLVTELRSAVDTKLKQDSDLLKILSWVNNKADERFHDREMRREFYLSIVEIEVDSKLDWFLNFHRTRIIALDRANSEILAFDIGRSLDPNLDLDIGLDLDRALYRILAVSHTYFSPASPDKSFDRIQVFDRLLDFDVRLHLARARARARELKWHKLEKALGGLQPPDKNSETTKWNSFSVTVRAIMSEYRDLGRIWRLSDEQIASLVEYFRAARLLKDCLALAAMHPDKKKEVEEGLFLMPY